MKDYDVIVIGGGPAGCYAALASATRGCRVAIFEEHLSIGWPRHDPGWLMQCAFTESIINFLGRRVPWIKVHEYHVIDAESSNVIEKSTLGGYLVRRDLLEKELAALCLKVGSELYIGIKVSKLIRKGRDVESIETNSTVIPRARARIFICADGIRSADNGFAVSEGICQRGKVRQGLSYLLANANVDKGVIEHFLSINPNLNYRCFWPHHNNTCFFDCPSSTVYKEIKEMQDNPISLKIRNAYPVEVNGYNIASSGKRGEYFQNIIRNNVIFIGNASGGSGNIHGMIQGRYAGIVAASAIKDKDTSEKKLAEYQDLVNSTLSKAPFFWFSAREDFGSFDNWFKKFEESTNRIEATELIDNI